MKRTLVPVTTDSADEVARDTLATPTCSSMGG